MSSLDWVPTSTNFAQMYEQHYELAIATIVVIGGKCSNIPCFRIINNIMGFIIQFLSVATALLIKFCFLQSPVKTIRLINDEDEDDQEDSHYITPVPRVPITIAGTVIPAVWATGSAYSYISDSWAKKLFSSEQILPTNERAQAMGGKPFTFIGAVKCTVKLGSFEVPHTLFVTPDHFPTKALLGYDFMAELGVESESLNLLKGTLTLNNEVIALCAKDGGRYQSKVSGEAELTSLYSVSSP